MAVLEIHVPTGYVVTNDVLRAYAQSGDVPMLRRAESYGRKVVFYFDHVGHTSFSNFTVRLCRLQHKL